MFSILRIFFVFSIICNPVYDDCYLIFNINVFCTEKHLFFTKYFSYFVLKTASRIFRFFSTYSFALFVISFYISDDG